MTSIRGEYEKHSPRGYYESRGSSYRNPHEPILQELLPKALRRWRLSPRPALDLACGSGEATLILRGLGFRRIDGVDPFTADAYLKRTGRAAERLGFEEIAAGALDGRRYGLIVCSFALHLVAASRLHRLLWRLAGIAPEMVVLTPHKRPKIDRTMGWTLCEEIIENRVRARRCVSVSEARESWRTAQGEDRDRPRPGRRSPDPTGRR